MRRRRRGLMFAAIGVVTIAVVVAIIALAGGGGDSKPLATSEGETLVIAIPGTPSGIDLDRQAGPQTYTMAGQVVGYGAEYKREDYPFESTEAGDPTEVPGFTYPDLDLSDVEPGTIERCDLSEDGKRATYHLRKNVVSPYGNEFTAKDVLWGVERSIALEGIGAFFLNAANADELSQWKQVDRYSVEISSKTPMALVCSINAHLFYSFGKSIDSTEAKRHATRSDPWATEWLATHDASFGPYHITRWESGKEVVMEANPNYYGEAPNIKRIVWRVVPESASRVSLLRAGEVDVVEGLGPEEVADLSQSDNVNPIVVRSNLELYIVMNNERKPTDDVRVRQALNYAVPRKEIVDSVYRGLAFPWEGIIPSIYPGYVAQDRYEEDLDRAKALLAEAGYEDGFTLPLAYGAGDPAQEQVAILLQTVYRQLGVRLELRKLPPAAHSDLVQSGRAEFAMWSDAPFLPDPNFSTKIWYRTGIASNWENYSNPRVDRLIDKCNLVTEYEERLACHEPLQELISQDAPHVWISSPDFMIGLGSQVGGWGWDPSLTYRVATMTKE